jgi:hypothetical protein
VLGLYPPRRKLSVNQQHDDGQGQDKGRCVAVKESHVTTSVVLIEHWVANDMACIILLPEAAWRTQACLVGEDGCKNGQQKLAPIL